MLIAQSKQLLTGVEGIRLLGGIGDDTIFRRFVMINHETATYGVIVARSQFVAFGVVCGKAHAIGVERQLLALVENQVALFVKIDLVFTEYTDTMHGAYAFEDLRNLIGID